MSSNSTSSFTEAELERFREEVFRNTSLVRSLSRVVLEFFNFLGVQDAKELKLQHHSSIIEMYEKYGYVVDKDPDDVLSSFVLSFIRRDVAGRFETIMLSLGTSALRDVPAFPVVDLHTTAVGNLKYPFYGFSLCVYKHSGTIRDGGYSVLGFCGDQVLFDKNDESEEAIRFSVRDLPKEVGVDIEDIKLVKSLCSQFHYI